MTFCCTFTLFNWNAQPISSFSPLTAIQEDIKRYVERGNSDDLSGLLENYKDAFTKDQISNILKRILDTYVDRDWISDGDFSKGLALATVMTNHSYHSEWAQICKALLYFSKGDEVNGNQTVRAMVDWDQQNPHLPSFRNRLLECRKNYYQKRHVRMWDNFKQLLTTYDQLKLPLLPITSASAFDDWSKYQSV